MSEAEFKTFKQILETFEIVMSTKLNDELQIRRLLIEKVENLEKQLAKEKAAYETLSNMVKCYEKDRDSAKEKYNSLVNLMDNIAMQIPQQYRRQIKNALPNQ
ncbi:GLTP domain-containing protein [Emticicia fontis]